jgi:hypothetical protein
MSKTAVPVAKSAAPKAAPAENKSAVKVLPSVQPMQLAADTEQQNSIEGFFEPGPGKMAPSSPFQFKSTSSLIPTNHSPIQRKSSSTWAFQPNSVGANSDTTSPVQRAAAPANKTGLPDNVKSGVEQLSGISLGDVKVHYNSPKPAQLQAHAYAQGTDIHVASGQEKHVPHEAWHVVQQKQGRVQANTQLKGNVPVNDDAGLETEADVMGAKALNLISNNTEANNTIQAKMDNSSSAIVQRVLDPEDNKMLESVKGVSESKAVVGPELRKRLESEKVAIESASDFSSIGQVIDNAQGTTKQKGEAAIKLRNTDVGVNRAREYFQKMGMAAEQKAFIDDRLHLAILDQKTGIATKGIGETLSKNDYGLEEADYSSLQWDATMKGSNKEVILKQELLTGDDMQKTADIAKGKGGLSKLIGMGGIWDSMNEKLNSLWIEAAGGDKKNAKSEWEKQSTSEKRPSIIPNFGAVNPDKFIEFSGLAAAFSKPVTGCMGMAEDYQFQTIKQACDALGLQENWYTSGAFIVTIPTDKVEIAIENAKKVGGGVGKASVFTSLAFSEFNYIAEDRATNETESGDAKVNANAKKNSGVKSAGGKTEVVAKNFLAADIFSQNPQFLI